MTRVLYANRIVDRVPHAGQRAAIPFRKKLFQEFLHESMTLNGQTLPGRRLHAVLEKKKFFIKMVDRVAASSFVLPE